MLKPLLHCFAELDSTNDHAKKLASEGAPDGLIVQALRQRKGRGRGGHHWVSPLGNLYLSIVFRPQFPIEYLPLFTYLPAFALLRSLAGYEIDDLRIKWPNDVLIGQRKLGGCLLENSICLDRITSVVGVGINVQVVPDSCPEGFRFSPISIKEATGRNVSLNDFRDSYLVSLFGCFQTFFEDSTGEGRDDFRNNIAPNLYGLGEMVVVEDGDRSFQGRLVGVGPHGEITLETEDGRRTIGFFQGTMRLC